MIARRLRQVLFVLTAFASTAPGWSSTIFTNFGTNDSYDTGTRYTVDRGQWLGVQFTPSASGAASSILLPLGMFNGGTYNGLPSDDLLISLRAPGSDPTGTVLESWPFAPTDLAFAPSIRTLNSVVHPILTSATAYWLRVESDAMWNAQTCCLSYTWSANSTGMFGVKYTDDQGLSWINSPVDATAAFEVNASAVPEPSSAMLLTGSLALVALSRRWRVSGKRE